MQIGDIFNFPYSQEVIDFCNAHQNVRLAEIDPIVEEVEETYTEEVPVENEVVVADVDENGIKTGEHTEIVTLIETQEKTRIVENVTRRFQLQEIEPEPEPTTDEKQAAVRAIRDNYIRDIEWRVSRYRDQVELQIETSDTEETYIKILQYMQYLRDYPESSETWYEQNPMTFEEWQTSQD